MAKHVVKHYYWNDENLTVVEHQFDSYDEAFSHAELSNAQTVKLFSPSGELLKETQSVEVLPEGDSTPTE
jgi:hypothetical protein